MSSSYARRILNQTDESVKAESQRIQRLVAIRNQITILNTGLEQLLQDISRDELKILVNEDQWDAIGNLFGFTPQYLDFQGRKVFNWQSCNAAFWKVFKPPVIGDLSEGRIYLKALAENQTQQKPTRKPKPIPKGTQPNPKRLKPQLEHGLKVVVPVTAPADIWMSPNRHRVQRAGKRRIYEPEDLEFVNRLVWMKTRGRCFYCKRRIVAKLFISSMVKDHFIPLIADGPDDHSNLVPSCRPCDTMKGSKLPLGLPRSIREKYVKQSRGELPVPA